MSVRTHSVYWAAWSPVPFWICRGCGERWSCDDIDAAALERQPCGTREGPRS